MRLGFIQSNCIILCHNTSIKTKNIWFNPENASKITTSQNVCLLVNISIEANSVDPDQTAPTGAVWSGSILFVEEAISADDKTCCDMLIKGI